MVYERHYIVCDVCMTVESEAIEGESQRDVEDKARSQGWLVEECHVCAACLEATRGT